MTDSSVVIAENPDPLVYHKPDSEGDKPACNQSTRDVSWRREKLDELPDYRPCKLCSGDFDWGNAGYRPSDLAGQLVEMDPEAI